MEQQMTGHSRSKFLAAPLFETKLLDIKLCFYSGQPRPDTTRLHQSGISWTAFTIGFFLISVTCFTWTSIDDRVDSSIKAKHITDDNLLTHSDLLRCSLPWTFPCFNKTKQEITHYDCFRLTRRSLYMKWSSDLPCSVKTCRPYDSAEHSIHKTCLFVSCRRRHFVFLRFIYSKEASVQKSSSRIASSYQQLKFVARSKILANVFRDGLDGGILAELKLCFQLDTKPLVDSGFFCAEPLSPFDFFSIQICSKRV